MSLRGAMRVLTDEQLLVVHEKAQSTVTHRLLTGYTNILGSPARQARAAKREIIARGRFHDARNHTTRNDNDRTQ